MPLLLTQSSTMMCPHGGMVTAERARHSGDFVLTEASVGLCLAGDQAPQGVVMIQATQPRSSGL